MYVCIYIYIKLYIYTINVSVMPQPCLCLTCDDHHRLLQRIWPRRTQPCLTMKCTYSICIYTSHTYIYIYMWFNWGDTQLTPTGRIPSALCCFNQRGSNPKTTNPSPNSGLPQAQWWPHQTLPFCTANGSIPLPPLPFIERKTSGHARSCSSLLWRGWFKVVMQTGHFTYMYIYI